MIPIFEHGVYGSKGYTLSSFMDKLVSICAEHRTEGRALFFAVILWDYTQPQIYKVLNDKDYWQALDKISGDKLSIFSIHTPAWLVQQQPALGSDTSSTDPIIHNEQILQQYFDIRTELQLPSLLFFQVGDNQIINHVIVNLLKQKTEDIYIEIANLIKDVVESVSEVKKEFYGNYEEIFNLVLMRLEDRKMKASFSAIVKSMKAIKEFGSCFGCIS